MVSSSDVVCGSKRGMPYEGLLRANRPEMEKPRPRWDGVIFGASCSGRLGGLTLLWVRGASGILFGLHGAHYQFICLNRADDPAAANRIKLQELVEEFDFDCVVEIVGYVRIAIACHVFLQEGIPAGDAYRRQERISEAQPRFGL